MSLTAANKFRSIRDFPELVEYLGDELDWPIETDDFEEMTFEYSAAELGLDEKTAPKFLEIRRLRPLDKDQPWGIFFIRFDDNKLPVVALRRLLSKLVLKKRSTSNSGDRASWHESDLLLISQTGNLGTQSISFAHFAANPEKTDLPILKVLGWDDDDTGLKIDYVIETLREKLIWPDDPTDSDAWRAQWRDAFTLKNREVIQSSKEMAERLGQLALAVRTRLREVLAIESDEGPIHKLMSVFKENLISDLDTDSFSDMYAQTIAYGLLSARIINPKANTADAAHTQIPITNPFLRDLMETFLNVGGRSHSSGVGLDFDELGINEVVDLLDNTNMEAVLRDFGDRNQKEDPVMHFFEGFLQEYDSKIRKDRGVFYTPQPVVSFIVRSVDEQLRTEFGLADGLADTTTWGELAERTTDLEIPKGTSPDQAFVQILDPATGTGTFPVEVIDLIYKTMTAKWQSQGNREAQIKELWNDYVPRHLLPRLHGYELMMAPYAIAHMKIGLKLYETGYGFKSDERARIYLTNALEPAQDYSGTFVFAIPALAVEVKSVNKIKKNQSFTVVLGNPPYSGHSANSSDANRKFVEPYYFCDGKPLGEKNPKWLQDDYVKFIAFGQSLISKTGCGVMSYITNHGFIDNPTFRGMRQELIRTNSRIHILDLHGNSTKKEVSPDGSADENVFEIKQGVVIFVAILRKKTTKNSAFIKHGHLYGKQQHKYDVLKKAILQKAADISIPAERPFYLFIPQNRELNREYQSYPSITEIIPKNVMGFQTHRDNFVVDMNSDTLWKRIETFRDTALTDEQIGVKFEIKNTNDWKIKNARKRLREDENWKNKLVLSSYRPFDSRPVYFSPAVVDRPRRELLEHVVGKKNLCLGIGRQGNAVQDLIWNLLYISEDPMDSNIFRRGGINIFPLWLYPPSNDLDLREQKHPNLSKSFLKSFSAGLDISKINCADIFSFIKPEEIFYYIYAVLSSTTYRSRYADFLKIDFPRIPLPSELNFFRSLSQYGEIIVNRTLMRSMKLASFRTSIVGNKNFEVEKVSYSSDTIWLDKAKTYGFKGVSEQVWEYKVGGFQVCEKWLKDRGPKKGNPGLVLTHDDLVHYQKVIFSIEETIRIAAEIDQVIDVHGGWPNAFITANS